MSEFLERIAKLSPQRLALLANELNERLQALEQRRRVPLAIVGMGCRMPGGVANPEEFWKLLSDGVDAVTEVPRSRWNQEEFYDRNPDAAGKMVTHWGGFIDDPDQFDAKFFGIAPAEAIHMDPQQRLLLETSWEALEHGGIAPLSLAGTATGVFVGICNGDYSQLALNAPREEFTPYLASGVAHAIAAGRISYVLGLQGQSLAVDTSCSASLVAVHLACQSLRSGESDMALAGGVNLILNPDITIALSQGKMMAPDGRCKAFSDAANGFVRSEGCGMIVLKRLPDALRDGNRILAVIRGSACNQDGRSSGLTAPNGPSQEAVIAAALADAGMRPDDVDTVEAHGTGTALGDPIEAEALNAVFAGRREPLVVGSVKTNLGHLESAAGIAGLMKLVLSMEQGKLPASLHLGKPNPRIEWERLPLQVPTAMQPWPRRGVKRVGSVSSFAFSGTNAHVVVEEFPESVTTPDEDRPLLFPISAKTPSALEAMRVRLLDHLEKHPSLRLADVARTLNAGRSHFEFRAAVVASTRGELLERLSGESTMQMGRAVEHSPRVAFIFGGEPVEGDAGRELLERAPVFRDAMARCEDILRKHGDVPAEPSRAAGFMSRYALAELWRSVGVEPAAVAGCGVGEYVAACVAGVLRLEDGLRLAVLEENSAAFEEFVRSISFDAPRIPVILNVNEAAIDTAEYWLRRRRENVLNASALSALARENSAANLYIGGAAGFRQLVKGAGRDLPGRWLASPGSETEECREFFDTAAWLYIVGCDLDMTGFYGDATRLVSLPTYPFERERYWLNTGEGWSEKRRMAVALPDSRDDVGGEPDEWIYDLVWEPKPLTGDAAFTTAVLDDALLARMAVTSAGEELMRVARAANAAMPVYATYIVEAFRQAGLEPLPKAAFTLEELSERLKAVPGRRRLLERMLGILIEDKLVERDGERFRFVDLKPRADASRELRKLAAEYPESRTEMEILRRCGEKLCAVLQGAYDPMQLVFADGSIGEMEQIYEHSPVCRFFNEKAARTVRSAIDSIVGRPARILEIGAGTGASTGPILAELAGKDVEYTFTDVSGVFLSRARAKFSYVPSMIYRLLDIEKDPIEQGLEQNRYDVVIAANVLHATADLRRTIAHARQLLAPGGVMLLIEGVSPDRWLDLTLGLTDGWFRFVDRDLRPEHPLVSVEDWTRLLAEAGMNRCRTIAYRKADGSLSQQRVIVGQVDASEKSSGAMIAKPLRDWMIFADTSGVGDALHKLLVAAGESCEIVRRPASANEADALFRRLETRRRNSSLEIVYLWGMDVEDVSTAAMLSRGEEICSRFPVHLMQSLLRLDGGVRLSIATRGAQATESFAPSAGGALQSLAWGVGRVFGVEAPERYRGLIDLDPTAPLETAATNLLTELLATDGEDQVAYRKGQRLVARLAPSRLKKFDSPSSALRQDGSYLLVGGLGGVGLRLARWAAERRPGHLILLSRTGASAGPFAVERTKAIEEIRGLGVDVTVVEGDVASEADMRALFRRFDGEFPPLRGIFHVATVVDGTKIADVTDAKLEAMLRAKVAGTWVLHELTKTLPLDFFVAFSSTPAILGSKGMAHYAAANQFLDTFAHTRRAMGLPMLSVDWGSWDVLRLVSAREQAWLAETGLLPMPTEKALDFMETLIRSSRAQVMIADIDWKILKPLFEANRRRPMLEKLGGAQDGHPAVAAVSQVANLRAAMEMTSEDRKRFVEAFVMEQAAQVLGLRHGERPPLDVPLTDMGLDSLMAVDLKNRLQIGLGQELSPTVVFDYPTVAAMAEMLETMLWAGYGGAQDEFASAREDVIHI